MQFLDPLAGLAGLCLAAIVALYFLKARRPPRQVPSTLWWRPVTLDRQASAPWQKLRPSWLLALQLLAATLVVGALLQPAFATAQALSGQTIVIIDTSATMQATDVHPSRFAAAVADARSLVERLGPRAKMTLISMGPSPSVLASSQGDRQALLQALRGLRPSDGPADLQDALQLAVAAAGAQRASTRLVIISDGITEPLPGPITLPFPYEYERVGVSEQNTGITALSVVPGLNGQSALAHVQNFGQLASHPTAEMFADGTLVSARRLDLGPHSGEELSFPVPPGTSAVRVALSPPDAFGLDQVAVAVATPPAKVKILLVSAGDIFLQKALALRPDAEVFSEAPSQWRPVQASPGRYNLLVFDGFVPPSLPKTEPYLVVGPPADKALGVGPALSPGPLLPAQADNPLLYDVDLTDVSVAASADLRSSRFGNVVVTSDAGPVLLVRPATTTAPAAALLGVYLHDSDFVLRSAFPVLVEHLSEYLAPGTVPAPSQAPGADVTISPGAGATGVTVRSPDGHRHVVWQAASTSAVPGELVFAGTSQPGLYQVEVTKRHGPPATSYFAVDVPGQSIAPARSLDIVGAQGKSLPASSLYKSVWPWLALAGLVLLLAEWVVYHRAS